MSEEESQAYDKMKGKDLVWLLKEDRTQSIASTSAAKKSGRVTPDQHRNWKVLERGKSEVQSSKTDLDGEKDLDPKLKRSTSFPVKPAVSASNKDRLGLRYPVHECEEEGEFSPVLYRSKSSLWSVSTESSAVTAQHKCDNRQSEMSQSNSKLGSSVPARIDLGRSIQSPLGAVDRRSNRDLSINNAPHSRRSSPQPPKPQRSFSKMQSSESVTSQPKTTKGLPMSVQDFKSKADRDPQLANKELKVSFLFGIISA